MSGDQEANEIFDQVLSALPSRLQRVMEAEEEQFRRLIREKISAAEGLTEPFHLRTVPSGLGRLGPGGPQAPKFQIVETESGEVAVELFHPWMARNALDAANELGTEKDGWASRFQRKMGGLMRQVPCPTCKAAVGSPCRRPSEHPLMGGVVHKMRQRDFDDWLIELPAAKGGYGGDPSLEPGRAPTKTNAGRFFGVGSPKEGAAVIKDRAITENWKRSLRVRKKNPVAVLLPCSGTKPFPESPSHKRGYLEALEGLDVDLYVVSEPLGVVPYSWSRTWPNDSYDFPPKHLKGEGREILADRIGEWFERVGSKYRTVVSALPKHHRKLVDEATGGDFRLIDGSISACRSGSCTERSFRATSPEYKKWLRRKVKSHMK